MADAEEYKSMWTNLCTTSFSQGFVNIDGVKTRYVHAGDPQKPALILLHGTGGSWETYGKNLSAHAQHFNCYALDMVGNGFSDKPDTDYEIPVYVEHVRKFMLAMGIKKASITGVSLGAWVAVKFASLHPDMTEKLTLLASSGLIANKETMERIRTQRSNATSAPTWDTVKNIFKSLLHDQKTLLEDMIAVRLAVYRLPGAEKAMAHILCLQDYDIRVRNLLTEDEWRGIKAPTLIIGAPDHDDDYYKTGLRIAKLLPNNSYVEIKGVNHWGHFEKPEEFNKLNIDFLQGR